MSILIKGMKMPKNCDTCDLCYDYIECMAASNVIKINFETRPKECPLVEVQEAHGRLIDADALKMDVCDVCGDYGDYAEFGFSRDMVDAQPTIIEAEGEKEDV